MTRMTNILDQEGEYYMVIVKEAAAVCMYVYLL